MCRLETVHDKTFVRSYCTTTPESNNNVKHFKNYLYLWHQEFVNISTKCVRFFFTLTIQAHITVTNQHWSFNCTGNTHIHTHTQDIQICINNNNKKGLTLTLFPIGPGGPGNPKGPMGPCRQIIVLHSSACTASWIKHKAQMSCLWLSFYFLCGPCRHIIVLHSSACTTSWIKHKCPVYNCHFAFYVVSLQHMHEWHPALYM